MNVDVFCPQCGTLFTVRREILGKKAKCTKCGTLFVIAEPARSAAPASSPPQPAFDQFPEIDMSAPAPTTSQAAVSAPGVRSPVGEALGLEYEESQPPFSVLRIVARAYEILAFLVLVVAAILLVMFVVAVIRNPSEVVGAMLASGMTIFWAVIVALTLLFFAQLIRLALQVEQNTREARDACRQLADHLCGIERQE